MVQENYFQKKIIPNAQKHSEFSSFECPASLELSEYVDHLDEFYYAGYFWHEFTFIVIRINPITNSNARHLYSKYSECLNGDSTHASL